MAEIDIEAIPRLDQLPVATTGSNLQYSGATTNGQVQSIASGTKASPDTNLNVLLKASRTISLLSEAITGDAVEQAAVGEDITIGTTTNQIQTVGRAGIAANEGETKGATDSPDACGLYGVGRILNKGIGVGMGAFFRGETTSSTGKLSGIQIEAHNSSGRTDVSTIGEFPSSSIMWLWANGPNQIAEGVSFANPFGTQVDVGWHFNGQTGKTRTDAECITNSTAMVKDTHITAADVGSTVSGPGIPGNTVILSVEANVSFTMNRAATKSETVSLTIKQNGPTITADLVSDSTAKTGILIRGTHSTAAIAVAAGSGSIIFGGTTALESSTIFEVQGTETADPLAFFGSTTHTSSYSIRLRNSLNASIWFLASGTNAFITGTKGGDSGFEVPGGQFFHIGGTSSVLKVGHENTIAFFNVAAVGQQATTGTTTGFTAGAGTTMNSASTSTGGSGEKAYTFGDLVLACKNYGLLAA